jgi:hypothetical protein
VISDLIAYIDGLVKREPVRASTWAAAAVTFVLLKLGIVVPEASVLNAVEVVLPLIFAGEVGRGKVTPVK